MQACASASSYWAKLAHAYSALGPPLRPSADDLMFIEHAVARWPAAHSDVPLRALLLGVTPDLASMRWPHGSSLLSLDNSHSMVQAVWPGNVAGQRAAVCGDWLQLPFRDSSFDVVLGDGSLSCLPYPHGVRALAEAVYGALSDDGLFLLRCYMRPETPETPVQVFGAISGGGMPTFHFFKMRLLMAVQRSAEEGVKVDDVYRCWCDHAPKFASEISRAGWDRAAMEMIELYRGSTTVYSFPSRDETHSVLFEFFEEVAASAPAHAMGVQCPVLVMKSRR